jgi:capsular polysaccharide transport system permease protein
MPSDNVEDDELGPLPGGGRDDDQRRKRRDANQGFGATWRRKSAPPRDPELPQETGRFTPLALPAGTAHQIELLLGRRRRRLQSLFIRLALFVLLPTFVVWFFAALIATPRYVCDFEITYQAYEPNSTLAAGLAQSDIGTSVMDSVDYGTLLYEYIRSAALAESVDKQINLREHYSSRHIDFLSRLPASASQARFLAYWRDHVVVSEGFGGYLTVSVQGFEPAFTLLLAQTISADADKMIDGLSAQARKSEVQSATDQLKLSVLALQRTDDALTVFRNTHGDLDPGFAATQIATVVGTLESQLALLRAQLQQAQANMQPNASQIVQLKLQVAAMEQQIQSERQRLADSSGSTYSNTVAQYDNLLADQQLANTLNQSAQQGLVIAQANAESKQNYSVAFVPPILPDHPTLPDPLISSLTTFLVFFSLYAICSLLFAAFRDQAGV